MAPLRRPRLLPLLVLLGFLLPGCLDDADPASPQKEADDAAVAPVGEAPPDGAPPADDAPSAATRAPETHSGEFRWVLDAAAEVKVLTTTPMLFDVPEGATLVRAEAQWTCPAPTCALAIEVGSGQRVERAEGDGAGVVEASDPEAGEWWFYAGSAGATATALVEGNVQVTVFFDDPAAAGAA